MFKVFSNSRASDRRLPAAVLLAAGAAVWSAASGTAALTSDREQPIQIEADQAEADDSRQVTIYKGAVVITQGTLRITGDRVTVHYDNTRGMTKMVAEGKPARFQQRPDGAGEDQHSKARRMEYYADRDLIILLGEAQSWQGRDRISADRIVYDTLNSRVKAESVPSAGTSTAESSGRVKITIVPKGSGSGQ